MTGRRPRVVVCGTGFGRVYLAGVGASDSPFELAGILARGSERSLACARRWGVPLYQTVGQLPDDIDLACVVVGSAMTGGPGAQLAMTLMQRGIHVLQEHPLHADELAECLRTARRHAVAYRVNTHHVHVAPVRRFITAVRALARQQRPLFVDAAGGFSVLYSLLDVLGAALGRLRPWGFAAPARLDAQLRALSEVDPAFRSLDGVLAGVPTTLRVQNQLDPGEPDNHAHLWHRVTVGSEGGNLTLVSSAGPLLWSTRAHLPRAAATHDGFDRLTEGYLGYPSVTPIGPPDAPAWSQVVGQLWPSAVRVAVAQLWREATQGPDRMAGQAAGQYHLALCQLTAEIAALLGPVELLSRPAPRILAAHELTASIDSESIHSDVDEEEPCRR